MGNLSRRDKSTLYSLTDNELQFVRHLLADDLWRPVVAAKNAGYKSAASTATRLLKKPAIQRALGHEQRRRLVRLGLKADEVLNVLSTGLFFNPLTLFKPSADGTWVVEDLDKVPDEIGRCIESVKAKTEERMDDEGNVETKTYFEIRFMAKTKLLELAMKHCGIDGTQKIEHSGSLEVTHGLSQGLNELLEHIENTRKSQVIDGRVIEDAVATEKANEH